MDAIAQAARPVVEAALTAARRRERRAALRRSAAEAAMTRLRSPEDDPCARPDAAWSPARWRARERFRMAHLLEMRATDDLAALEEAAAEAA